MINSNKLVILHLKLKTRLVVAGRLTGKCYHCMFVGIGKKKKYTRMPSLKAILCGCSSKSIFSCFIHTSQFYETHNNLSLKALIVLLNNKTKNNSILKLPKSHLSPYIPASHPFGQVPVT